jgi:hypothetical protein
MKPTQENQPTESMNSERREVMQKLGRFAVYAAPFTVLAMTQKADASTAHGPAKGGVG